MICTWCQDIFVGRLSIGRTFIHHQDACSLQKQAQEGCHFCTLVWEQFNVEDQPRILAQASWQHPDGKPYPNRTEVTLSKLEPPYVLSYTHARLNITNCLQLVPANDSKYSATELDTGDTTASEASWRIASQWISECLLNHGKCKPSRDGVKFLPTRLVDVGLPDSPDGPKLHVSATSDWSISTEYLTLSHCWGKIDILKLLTTNIKALREQIPVSKLPKTFQEAIILTKRMGYRYIWIDSLCIIQDSVEDWEREAAVMGDVYKHATLNISATGAEDGRMGLFFQRNTLLVQPCEVDIVSKKDKPAYPKSGTYRVIDQKLWEREIDVAPLNSRGWVFQERFLSPRKLSFGAKQLYWECSEFRASESFPAGLPDSIASDTFKVSDPIQLAKLFPQAKLDPVNVPKEKQHGMQLWLTMLTGTEPMVMQGDEFASHDGNASTPNAFRLWTNVIKHYARKQLSVESDKLPALAGVAKWYQGLFKDDVYLAGLWRSHLIDQLLWEISPNSLATRPKAFRAPSWSWASVDGRVGFRDILESSGQSRLAEVVDASISTKPGDSTGAVTAGFVTLKGRLVSAPWKQNISGWPGRSFCFKLSNDTVTGISDVEGSEFLSGRSLCLPIQGYLSDSNGSSFSSTLEGLVLEGPYEPSYEYKRIGWFAAHDTGAHKLKELWDGLGEQLVLIV